MKVKTILASFLLVISISSCSEKSDQKSQSFSQVISYGFHDCSEVKNLMINWEGIFIDKEDYYIVYFFGENCLHCNNIKNEVIFKALNSSKTFYFCNPNNGGTFGRFPETTIGVDSIDNFFIFATPSIAVIENHKVIINTFGEDEVLSIINNYS